MNHLSNFIEIEIDIWALVRSYVNNYPDLFEMEVYI